MLEKISCIALYANNSKSKEKIFKTKILLLTCALRSKYTVKYFQIYITLFWVGCRWCHSNTWEQSVKVANRIGTTPITNCEIQLLCGPFISKNIHQIKTSLSDTEIKHGKMSQNNAKENLPYCGILYLRPARRMLSKPVGPPSTKSSRVIRRESTALFIAFPRTHQDVHSISPWSNAFTRTINSSIGYSGSWQL